MLTARMHLKLWLEHDDAMLLGQGPVELLYRIDSMGSLKKAAESLNMSYRAAWGRIKRLEEALGIALVVTAGSRREGCTLSPEGRMAMEAFRQWEEAVRTFALSHAPTLPFLRVSAGAVKTPKAEKA
ncbi:MAG: LysR family transcriptional regulator [Desulfovibrionaceae bacterium]|nr:LysR family transcriptional regulator [Desulfovibrionaceae bacterium]